MAHPQGMGRTILTDQGWLNSVTVFMYEWTGGRVRGSARARRPLARASPSSGTLEEPTGARCGTGKGNGKGEGKGNGKGKGKGKEPSDFST